MTGAVGICDFATPAVSERSTDVPDGRKLSLADSGSGPHKQYLPQHRLQQIVTEDMHDMRDVTSLLQSTIWEKTPVVDILVRQILCVGAFTVIRTS